MELSTERIHQGGWVINRTLEMYVPEPAVELNPFLSREPEPKPIPGFSDARESLPAPFWPKNQLAIDAYWKAWELAWRNLRQPVAGSWFVSNYIDTAFNDCLFMWDSAFIVQYGRYGQRVFGFQGTLDNLYARQHPDGFICREIRVADGTDQWHRFNPSSTGPNVLAWAEWNYFQNYGDLVRLRDVFWPLVGYHRWMRRHRTWPNGTYWTTGLGCGMDNMARVPKGCDAGQDHAWMTWVDATLQAMVNGRILREMAEVLGVDGIGDIIDESDILATWVNENLWDEEIGFYCDRFADGSLGGIKSVAGFWALLAGIVPSDRLDRFVGHLSDPQSFNRHHRVPSLAADAPGYEPVSGDYWRGSVWPPTNYMVLRGLTLTGQDDVAFEVATNHHDRVLEVFCETGTFWENYAPEASRPGDPARPDFLGWSGLGPIAVFLEYILGLRPLDPIGGRLLWDIRQTDEIGVDRYPLGPATSVSLRCAARSTAEEEPEVTGSADQPVEVEVRWSGGSKVVRLG